MEGVFHHRLGHIKVNILYIASLSNILKSNKGPGPRVDRPREEKYDRSTWTVVDTIPGRLAHTRNNALQAVCRYRGSGERQAEAEGRERASAFHCVSYMLSNDRETNYSYGGVGGGMPSYLAPTLHTYYKAITLCLHLHPNQPRVSKSDFQICSTYPWVRWRRCLPLR